MSFVTISFSLVPILIIIISTFYDANFGKPYNTMDYFEKLFEDLLLMIPKILIISIMISSVGIMRISYNKDRKGLKFAIVGIVLATIGLIIDWLFWSMNIGIL